MPTVTGCRLKGSAREVAAKIPENLDDFRRDAPEVMNAPSAAKFLGVSTAVFLDSVDALKIPYKTVGRTKIFGREALVKWVNGQTEKES